MFSKRWIFWGIVLLFVISFSVGGQSNLRDKNTPFSGGIGPTNAPSSYYGPSPSGPSGGEFGARNYISQGQAYLANGRLNEAKEALRTAIRLEPMNLEAWALYDYVVETHYVGRAREEKLNPVIERDLKPIFSLGNVQSYLDYGSLFLVGEIKNVSDATRRRVEITGILFDNNKQELRRESTFLTLTDRGLFPNETCPFEIQFRNPPPGVKSFKVRVSNFE
jgi:tetratricopeptide (TPR) repeat protein